MYSTLAKSVSRKRLFAIFVMMGMTTIITARSFIHLQSHARYQEPAHKRETQVRFDALVRNDFFAGMMGDEARLDRGMKFCEDILARDGKHAEALVWHGGGLTARSAQAYRRGDNKLGDSLWQRGLDEMDQAVKFEPDNMGVKIGRSATLIGLAQSGWDSSDTSRGLLLSALNDYEKVYESQKPLFAKIGIHSRGELLFGLASGWSILGEREKSLEYLRLIVENCSGTNYEREARRWLATDAGTVVQHDCGGCHVK